MDITRYYELAYVFDLKVSLRLSIICNTNTFLFLVVTGGLSGLAIGGIVTACIAVAACIVVAICCWKDLKDLRKKLKRRGKVFIHHILIPLFRIP